MSFETFNSIVQIVAEIIALVLGGFLVPYIKVKIGESKYNKILQYVEEGVESAEQIYKKMEKSDEKDALRLKYAVDYLRDKNVKISEKEMKALIESAVSKLNKSIK